MSGLKDTKPGPGDDERRQPGEGFLGRWSRLKREPGADAPPAPQPDLEAGPSEPDERPRDPETGELIDEELVRSLPDIGSIQPGGDLSMFMRRGVPEALRRQALRAMWSADPAIRDFVSPALDYAYDYNAPGGAPGYGPLSESDLAQAREFLSSVFSDSPRKPEEIEADESDKESQVVAAELPSPVRRSDIGPPPVPDADPAAWFATQGSSDDSGAEAPDSCAPSSPSTSADSTDLTSESRENRQAQRTIRRRGGGASPI